MPKKKTNTYPRYTFFLTALTILALGLSIRLLYVYVGDATRFPIRTVKIVGTYVHIDRGAISEVVGPYIIGSFITLPVRTLYQNVMQVPWVREARIQRVWPDTLRIVLKEHTPVAIWNGDLLTEDGHIFKSNMAALTVTSDSTSRGLSAGSRNLATSLDPAHKPRDVGEIGEQSSLTLPFLQGPIHQEKEVLQVYEKMSKILSTYHLKMVGLVKRDNQAFDMVLPNKVLVHLGKQDIELRVLRFCRAYPAVFEQRLEDLVSVDLRYPRGMAVQWASPVTRQDNHG